MHYILLSFVLLSILFTLHILSIFIPEEPPQLILPKQSAQTIPVNTTVAFIADLGLTLYSRRLLQIVKDVDIIVHSGDVDYEYEPQLFNQILREEISNSTIYLASMGDHDMPRWDDYQKMFWDRLESQNLTDICSGGVNAFGIASLCTYKGISSFLSSIGTFSTPQLVSHLDRSLDTISPTGFTLVSFHRQMRALQIGGKRNATGWDVYEISRVHGAIAINGHAHSYARTKVVTNFTSLEYVDSSSSKLSIRPGQTISVCNGMGTPYLTKANFTLSEAHHFAKVLATNTNPASVQAAIICRFNPPERSDLSRGALCHLQSINDEILDTFELEVTGTRVDMINARETYRRSLALHLNMPEETPLHDLLVQSHRPWDWATYVYEKLTYGYAFERIIKHFWRANRHSISKYYAQFIHRGHRFTKYLPTAADFNPQNWIGYWKGWHPFKLQGLEDGFASVAAFLRNRDIVWEQAREAQEDGKRGAKPMGETFQTYSVTHGEL